MTVGFFQLLPGSRLAKESLRALVIEPLLETVLGLNPGCVTWPSYMASLSLVCVIWKVFFFPFQILKHHYHSCRYTFKCICDVIAITFQGKHLEVKTPCVFHINILTTLVNV